ncbi:MAG: EAL domain-containing protein [Actinomycetia bacterium]|nr:EAL domain-containing protein [Actinomycetes bacterium]
MTVAPSEQTTSLRYNHRLDDSAELIVELDQAGVVTWVSPSVERILGVPSHELVGSTDLAEAHPDDTEHFRRTLTKAALHGGVFKAEIRLRQADGGWCWFAFTIRSTMVENAQLIVLTGQDVSSRREFDQGVEGRARTHHLGAELLERARHGDSPADLAQTAVDRTRRALGVDGTAVFRLSAEGNEAHLVAVEGHGTAALATMDSQLVEGSLLDIASHSPVPIVIDDLRAQTRFPGLPSALTDAALRSLVAIRIMGPTHPWGVILASHDRAQRFGVDDGLALGTVAAAIARAVDLHSLERRPGSQLHDPVTGLIGPELFRDRVESALERATRSKRPTAICHLRIDNWEDNASDLTSEQADQLLNKVAHRIRNFGRRGDSLCRVDTSTFALLFEEIESLPVAADLAEQFVDLISSHSFGPDHLARLTVSAGAAATRPDGTTAEQLEADTVRALDAAIEKGGDGYVLYDLTDRPGAGAAASEARLLRKAVANNQFVLHYLPTIELRSGQLVGVEALLRWNHPEKGLLLPADFFPLAHDLGLVDELGAWVLGTACVQAARWRRDIGRSITISVNLSGRQFFRPGLDHLVSTAISRSGMRPEDLTLEMEESMLMEHADRSMRVLDSLREVGVQLAVDDFGTGYSSISRLRRFNVDMIKIDRSFVAGLGADAANSGIVAAIVAMAHSMGVRVIAEGVEAIDQVAELSAVRCDLAQGHFFSRALDAKDIDFANEAIWGV